MHYSKCENLWLQFQGDLEDDLRSCCVGVGGE